MPSHDLINTRGLLVDPPDPGADLLGKVHSVTGGGRVMVTSVQFDGGRGQHAARGWWPDATEGDPVLLRVLDDGLWAVGWEPA